MTFGRNLSYLTYCSSINGIVKYKEENSDLSTYLYGCLKNVNKFAKDIGMSNDLIGEIEALINKLDKYPDLENIRGDDNNVLASLIKKLESEAEKFDEVKKDCYRMGYHLNNLRLGYQNINEIKSGIENAFNIFNERYCIKSIHSRFLFWQDYLKQAYSEETPNLDKTVMNLSERKMFSKNFLLINSKMEELVSKF